jgi:hypothetical protein
MTEPSDIHRPLACHAASPSRPALAVVGCVRLVPPGSLRLRYSVQGGTDGLRIPHPSPPVRADRLWEHTCFEAFVAAAGSEAYREFNFSPSGAWAAYDFDGYRRNMRPADARDPAIRVRRDAHGFELEAALDATSLPAGPLRLALSAVIEDRDGVRSYWALGHPAAAPDFHHPDSFELVLDRAGPRPAETGG